MDTFKIISIIFMMIMIYQIFVLNQAVFKDKVEGFADAPVQSIGGVDDTNAINTLAQIAKNLMAGGVTVPGAINLFNSKTKFSLVNDPDNCFRIKDDRGAQVLAINDGGSIYSKGDGFILSGNDMTVKGSVNVGADLFFPNQTTIKGAGRLHMTGEELLYILNKKGVMIGKEWGGTGDLQVQGGLSVSGRNILAELDALKNSVTKPIVVTSRWDDGAFMAAMARHFNRDEPDGTKKDFLIKNESGDNWRWQTGIKMYGNQVWDYPQWLRNNGDCSGCANNPANGNDAYRVNI